MPGPIAWLLRNVLYGGLDWWLVLGIAAAVSFGLRRMATRKGREFGWKRFLAVPAAMTLTVLIVRTIVGGDLVPWRTCVTFPFAKRESEVILNNPRFTPAEVVHERMVAQFAEAQWKIDWDLVDHVPWDGGYVWTTPIVPDSNAGGFTALFDKNPGVVVYDDRSVTPVPESRVKRFNQTWEIGVNMRGTDNLEWFVTRYHPLCDADVIVAPLPITEGGQQEFVQVVRLSYRRWSWMYGFLPVARVPAWAGVMLVFADGSIESLSPDEAIADARLQEVPLIPSALALEYVQSQRLVGGILNSRVMKQDLIEIPQMPSENQMPYHMRAADGDWYYVVTAKPAGSSDALFRMYYINSHTGERSVYEYPHNQAPAGQAAAIRAIQSAANLNYDFVQDGRGDVRILEPRPLYKVDSTGSASLYWMCSLTGKDYGGVKSTVVVNARNSEEVREFTGAHGAGRQAFEDWFKGSKASSPPSPEVPPTIEALEAQVLQLLETVRKLKAEKR